MASPDQTNRAQTAAALHSFYRDARCAKRLIITHNKQTGGVDPSPSHFNVRCDKQATLKKGNLRQCVFKMTKEDLSGGREMTHRSECVQVGGCSLFGN